ncbi:MAG: HAD-IA family hydrolase [Coriobacteriia bacterium]|nr:HAD-IA family hydrolase [Coriobacteriia bacterium]
MPLEAVFFDVGNTLITTSEPEGKVFQEIASHYGYTLDGLQAEQSVSQMYRYYESAYGNDCSFWSDNLQVRKVWLDMYSLLCELTGITEQAKQIAEDVYSYYFSAEAWQPFADVLPVLQELKGSGLVLGTISNWDTTLRGILQGIGLGSYFKVIVASADVRLNKPNEAIFALACERLGVRAERAIHVGDHLTADASGALGAGLHAVLIDRRDRHVGYQDAPRINDLRKLPGLIASL